MFMEMRFTKIFERDYKKLSVEIKKRLDKQLIFLLENIKYPSLRVKKVKGYYNVWEGRITKSYRFTFEIKKEIYFVRRCGTHSILNNP